MADAKPPPPAGGNQGFTKTVTLEYPTGTPEIGIFYVFNGTGTGGPGTLPSIGTIPDHNALILGVNIGLTVLASFVVGMRLFTRVRFGRPGLDDMFICISLGAAFVIMAFNIHNVQLGMGKHIGDLDDAHAQQIERYHWYSQIIYCVSLGFTKLSMLSFLLHIHPRNAREFSRMRKLVIAVIIFVVTYTITSMITIIFTCQPIDGIWNSNIPTKCLNREELFFSISALNVFSDLLIVLLPLPLLKSIQINMKQKLTLGVLLTVSLVVCAASALRMSTLTALIWSRDPTWDMTKFSAWTSLEFNLAIICASVPALKPLVKHYIPMFLGSSFTSAVHTGINRATGKQSTFHSIPNESRSGAKSVRTRRSHNPVGSILTKITAGGGKNSQQSTSSTFSERRRTLRPQDIEMKSFYHIDGGSNEEIITHAGIIQTIEVDIASEKEEDIRSLRKGQPRAGF